jgi:hypothetical protein
MKNVTLLAATAAVGALIVSPVLAKDSVEPRSAVHTKAYKAKHMGKSRYMRHQARINRNSMAYRNRWDRRDDLAYRDRWDNRNGWDNRRSDFWPGAIVGGAIGTAGAIATGAVNTAGAIATAPFGGPYRDSYAYRDTYAYDNPGYAVSYNYNGVAIPYSSNYAARNGFVCQPGTMFKNKAGNAQLCQ